MSSILLATALALYLLTTATFVAHVITAHGSLRRSAIALLTGAFVVHALALAWRGFQFGYDALSPFQEGLSFIGCLTVGLYLLIARRTNFTIVGALISPIAFLFSLSAYAFEAGTPQLPPHVQSIWLPAHVAPAFAGYAVFTVAFCLSLTYLLQERQLKAKRRTDLFRRLPSLETLDTLNYRFVSWGFALFTIGLLTGSLLARDTWGELWSWEPVQVWSVLTWLLYAGLLQARIIGWRGRRAATLTIVGFVILVASFLSVNLVFPGKHGGNFG
jgi:cytochrome c-type biogenesis protein CcsB